MQAGRAETEQYIDVKRKHVALDSSQHCFRLTRASGFRREHETAARGWNIMPPTALTGLCDRPAPHPQRRWTGPWKDICGKTARKLPGIGETQNTAGEEGGKVSRGLAQNPLANCTCLRNQSCSTSKGQVTRVLLTQSKSSLIIELHHARSFWKFSNASGTREAGGGGHISSAFPWI